MIGRTLDIAGTAYTVVGATLDGAWSLAPTTFGENIELTASQLRAAGVPDVVEPSSVDDDDWVSSL